MDYKYVFDTGVFGEEATLECLAVLKLWAESGDRFVEGTMQGKGTGALEGVKVSADLYYDNTDDSNRHIGTVTNWPMP